MHERGTQTVARLCFYVFTPALTFGKLAQAMSLRALTRLWPLLANVTASICLGLAVGWAAAAALRTPRPFRALVTAAVAFGNVGNLPLVFVYALCGDRGALFYRSMGDDCEHLGVSYVAMDICAATLWQFTLAIQMLRPPPGSHAAAAAEAGGDLAAAGGGGSGEEQRDELQPAGEEEQQQQQQQRLVKHPTLSDLMAQGSPGGQPSPPRQSPPSTARGAKQQGGGVELPSWRSPPQQQHEHQPQQLMDDEAATLLPQRRNGVAPAAPELLALDHAPDQVHLVLADVDVLVAHVSASRQFSSR